MSSIRLYVLPLLRTVTGQAEVPSFGRGKRALENEEHMNNFVRCYTMFSDPEIVIKKKRYKLSSTSLSFLVSRVNPTILKKKDSK